MNDNKVQFKVLLCATLDKHDLSPKRIQPASGSSDPDHTVKLGHKCFFQKFISLCCLTSSEFPLGFRGGSCIRIIAAFTIQLLGCKEDTLIFQAVENIVEVCAFSL